MSKSEQKSVKSIGDNGKINVTPGNGVVNNRSENASPEEWEAQRKILGKSWDGKALLRDFLVNNNLIQLNGPIMEDYTGATVYSQVGDFIYIATTNHRFHVSLEVTQLPEYPYIQTGNPDNRPPFPVENLEVCTLETGTYRIDFDFYASEMNESVNIVVSEFDVQVVNGDTYQKYLRVYLNARIVEEWT